MFAFSVPPVVEVLEPPFNSPLQERVANQRIAFPCPAKGNLYFKICGHFHIKVYCTQLAKKLIFLNASIYSVYIKGYRSP